MALCPLSSQDNALYSRSVPGAKNESGNELSSLALASGGGGGGGGGQPLSPGDAEVIVYLNKEICTRVWDHQQVRNSQSVVCVASPPCVCKGSDCVQLGVRGFM